MFSTITSFLPSFTSFTALPPHSLIHPFSCIALRPFRPRVRLSLIHGSHPQIYGFPPSTTPNYLHLSEPPSAYLSYILGASWSSQLTIPPDDASNTTSNGCSRVNEYSYITNPNNDVNEAEHCLRMRRCGALLISSGPIQTSFEPNDRPLQATEKQILGWPSTGGVWILRIPTAALRFDESRYSDQDWLEAGLKALDEGEPEKEKIDSVWGKIRQEEDMNGVCEVLKEAGAVYYADLRECLEVVELGVFDL